jgi:uncharacterized protein YqeY
MTKKHEIKVLRINTTAYKEEDFFLLTDLSEDDIVEVIMPIVNKERDGYEDYDNEILVNALKTRYHGRLIEMYSDFDALTI